MIGKIKAVTPRRHVHPNTQPLAIGFLNKPKVDDRLFSVCAGFNGASFLVTEAERDIFQPVIAMCLRLDIDAQPICRGAGENLGVAGPGGADRQMPPCNRMTDKRLAPKIVGNAPVVGSVPEGAGEKIPAHGRVVRCPG